MNWTENKPPKKDEFRDDYTELKTPLGNFVIEWKSWQEDIIYNITMNTFYWIGVEYDLDSAKERVRKYLIKKHEELSECLNEQDNIEL